MKGVCILGATGSIGSSTLDVIARHPQDFRVVALTANSATERLYQQCLKFKPAYAVMADEHAAALLAAKLRAHLPETEVLAGVSGLQQVAALPQVDYVMAAIVGAAGLLPTLAAAQAGKRVLLANKEALVMAGAIFMEEVRRHGAELLPIDSEHNAIFQCLPAAYANGWERVGLRRLLLTSSGGPLLRTPVEALSQITPDQACAHPNWAMGRKISVDSATMMNKGLEVIEACWLFHTTPERVEVVIHPQSVVHSMVEYADGSILAQFGSPDMRIPIAHAMAWPGRMESGAERLDLFAVARLDFEAPDYDRFPCLRYAREAALEGGTAATILNAANEIAVAAFLDRQIRFTDIPRVIRATMTATSARPMDSLEDILADDQRARLEARSQVVAIRAC